MATILVGGDVCPSGVIESDFMAGNASAVFHDLLEEIASADLSIANLECPLVSQQTPILKAGPVLGADIGCINGFLAAKWQVLNLANNHSYDHGATGLRETIRTVEDAGLRHVGAGENTTDAQTPFITQVAGLRIVVYAMAEHEFSAASADSAGANPLDLIGAVEAIRQHKQGGVFVILIHGGNEYYPYPSPEMVRRCRFLIDMGADAVICSHTHCPLPWEIYANRPIVYGMGNLIFEGSPDEPLQWHRGYLAKLALVSGHVRFQAIPYRQSDPRGARRMQPDEERRFLNEMEIRGLNLLDGGFLRSEWAQFCRERRDAYLAMLFGHGRLPRRVRRALLRALHSDAAMRQALLLVQCEAHREVLSTIFDETRRRS